MNRVLRSVRVFVFLFIVIVMLCALPPLYLGLRLGLRVCPTAPIAEDIVVPPHLKSKNYGYDKDGRKYQFDPIEKYRDAYVVGWSQCCGEYKSLRHIMEDYPLVTTIDQEDEVFSAGRVAGYTDCVKKIQNGK